MVMTAVPVLVTRVPTAVRRLVVVGGVAVLTGREVEVGGGEHVPRYPIGVLRSTGSLSDEPP